MLTAIVMELRTSQQQQHFLRLDMRTSRQQIHKSCWLLVIQQGRHHGWAWIGLNPEKKGHISFASNIWIISSTTYNSRLLSFLAFLQAFLHNCFPEVSHNHSNSFSVILAPCFGERLFYVCIVKYVPVNDLCFCEILPVHFTSMTC